MVLNYDRGILIQALEWNMPPSLIENLSEQSVYSDTNYQNWKTLALLQWPRTQKWDRLKTQPKPLLPLPLETRRRKECRWKKNSMREAACFICKKKRCLSCQCPEKGKKSLNIRAIMEGITKEQKQDAIIKERKAMASSHGDKGKERATIEEVLEDKLNF